jgi:hypothetical protein
MATIFKLAKAVADNKEEVSSEKKSTKNKQRVLALSSRGINYRYSLKIPCNPLNI